jgi:hypothetical protein
MTTSLADQLIQAMLKSGARKMFLTTPSSTDSSGNLLPPLHMTLEFPESSASSSVLPPSSYVDVEKFLSKSSSQKAGTKRARTSSTDSNDEPGEESTTQSGKKSKKRKAVTRRVKKKVLDFSATLDRYTERIRQLPAEDFANFDGAILTDFKLHLTSVDASPATTHVFRLIDVITEKGFTVRGHVSANKKEGKYIEALGEGLLRPEEGGEVKLIYVGEKNQFTGQALSEWAIRAEDKVFVSVAESEVESA